ncbi:protein-methionine-sulfoxide reductase catalytic subunit MsrP [Roseomonas xinghualingensis]|uniref:protein-methionine-sulfoxide reductase catalytic subunit MsrP n=1 Tax=Roseomonas xinghualingensis TaxID=2986475 RepID=UPI0021F0E10F|nr:protein-methionine-sulfoxide reductase catalytic subunit MsrP [Roseomonas sp. SXEYE001]MCV4209782.1 protein-methionine-sulfoxide reductase catalytic subunit MsrP [Roseomonas sp. SXEYE001]
MLIRVRRGWELPESAATPEAVVMGRRAALAAGAALAGGAIAPPALAQSFAPAMRNPRYQPGREVTPERDATNYNNFYEFGSSKSVASAASRLKVSPWSVRFEGLVEQPRELALDDLLKQVQMEERVMRFRCVEAWAMTVPWTGFPVSELVRLAAPKPEAKYVVFQTAAQRDTMPGLRQSWYPWPYSDGCTIEEARNELAFMATGMYGKPLPPQNGAPLRVLYPWKYGFKGSKSVVRVTFQAERPVGYWEKLQASEYGFWANVNPEVAHPRWSQASERLLGTNERVPTRIFNGYGEFVVPLYASLGKERLYY